MHQNGMGRSRGRGRPNHYTGTGPLMTEHLRVKNLELELELLKHKREIVQREQDKLALEREMNRKRQYEHTKRNMSNTFGNVWQASSSKRANTPQQPHPWIDTTQNNFGPNMSKPISTHYIPPLLGHSMHQPVIPPPVKPIVHPILNNNVVQRYVRPINARKEFRNTHGIKKNRKDLPNKLNTYPVQERKNLVSKATESQLTKTKNVVLPGNPNQMILREDQVPSNQVIGRLELALGSIVKDICCNNINEKHKTIMSNPKQRRTVKQVIRERIRTIMLNKPVGSVIEIVNKYREKYPLSTDRDIVELVINSADPNFVNVTKTESPEEFFKKNITSLLENKVQEMSSNLLKMYNDIGYLKSLTYVKPAEVSKKPVVAGEKESVANNESTLKLLRALTGKYITTEENEILNKYFTELIVNVLKEKLPEFLPQCKEQFLKIFDMDQRFKTIISTTTKRVTLEMQTKGTYTLKDQHETNTETSDKGETQEKEADHNNKIEEEVVTKNNEMENEVDPENNEPEKTADKNSEIDDDVVIVLNDVIEAESSDNVNKEMVTDAVTENNDVQKETLLENMPSKEVIAEAGAAIEISEAMPLAIDAQKSSSIPKSLSSSSEHQTSEAINPTVLIAKETKPAETITPTTPMPKKTELSSSPKTPVTSSPLAKDLPYYVKLIGRPTLPNRAVICEFLNNYRPTSIKKHKSINNLLVVGFINQEDYNRILKANETVIGDITIIIKASEKANAGKANESLNDSKQDVSDVVVKEQKNVDKTEHGAKEENEICKEANDNDLINRSDEGSDIIGKELDDQITNLLSTIKEGEEDTTENTTPSSFEIKKEADDGTTTAETDKADKVPIKANVKESGRSTPVRSSRLVNVTPSTIRTRRSSRLMQE